MEVTVENNQSIWDIAIHRYGSPEGVKQLIIDNPALNFNDNVVAGTKIQITGEPINKAVFDFLSREQLIPATAINDNSSISPKGEFNSDFNNDFR